MEEKKWFEDHRHLAETRRKRGITQAELAKEAGISQRLVSAIERGTRSFLEPHRLWEALAEIEVKRREKRRAEEQPPKFARLTSLLDKLESEKPAEPLNAWGIINALGLDKSEAQLLREENENLKAQLKTEREYREVLESMKDSLPAAMERIRVLEESVRLFNDLLGIEGNKAVLNEKAEELRARIREKIGPNEKTGNNDG